MKALSMSSKPIAAAVLLLFVLLVSRDQQVQAKCSWPRSWEWTPCKTWFDYATSKQKGAACEELARWKGVEGLQGLSTANAGDTKMRSCGFLNMGFQTECQLQCQPGHGK